MTLWSPDPGPGTSRMASFARHVAQKYGAPVIDNYPALHRWSVEQAGEFWAAVWDFFDVRASAKYERVLAEPVMPGRGWFDGARLNYAENALRRRSGDTGRAAVVAVAEDGEVRTLGWGELCGQVGAVADWLRGVGVVPGDRVVGYLPNGPHAIVAFLACAAVGAVWSCCGPDYGAEGALSRFAQLDPVVLFAVPGYVWRGQRHDRRPEVEQIRAGLPSLRQSVVVHSQSGIDALPANDPLGVAWDEVVAHPRLPHFEQLPADAPLWVLFSSGTTGPPKGIVHSHGGVVVEHLKSLGLHHDLGTEDRFLWHTSTNWMLWNLQVSSLLLGATVVAYDGDPSAGRVDRLWQVAAEQRVTLLGTSPPYLQACARAGVALTLEHDLAALRMLGVTGSPLPLSTAVWTQDQLGQRVQLCSAAGGTDVVTAFATANPLTPVWAGELSAPALGVDVAAWDPHGAPVPTGELGELVILASMPSMPLYFWGDPDEVRYREAYLDQYPGVWRHGDWVSVTERGSIVFAGRSDSTLNRHGVRFGSADIYAALADIPEIRDSLVVGAELGDGEYWMPLFVELHDGIELDQAFRERIRTAIRSKVSPRHVPDDILTVPGVPHTLTGKRLEVPVKRLLLGVPVEKVVDLSAVDRPELLDHYQDLGTRRRARRPQG